jgi:hypothetical protein
MILVVFDRYRSILMQRSLFSAGLISAALIVSTVIAWLAILMPSHAAPVEGPVAKSVDVVVPMRSNTARKGDRLNVEIAHGTNSMPMPPVRTGTKIPVGCDTAFSELVKSEKIAVRCVT